jgi:predicted O-methyltransferase YrrM
VLTVHVAQELLDLAGGDRFIALRLESEDHQKRHGCGLHNAGGPQMQLVAGLARSAGVKRALDLGLGSGHSRIRSIVGNPR